MPNTLKNNNGAKNRPPVVCVMGHIDHGKSTLLDYVRKTSFAEAEKVGDNAFIAAKQKLNSITAEEKGGITQHIGAYEVIHKTKEGVEKKITFLDTPGHEAFKATRSRGAITADIAVLVISAEDSVMPQTVEALDCIKKNKIPFIIAITKIDKPSINVERVKQDLLGQEVYPEGYGGVVPWVATSSKTGEGIAELLDLICLIGELNGLKGNPSESASGVVIESHLDREKGVAATLIVKNGTLKKGMAVVADDAFSPIRFIENQTGKEVESATMSAPARVIGWNKLPRIGAQFQSFKNKREAEKAAELYAGEFKKPASKEISGAADENVTVVPLVIKTDVSGTAEAIKHEINKIKSERLNLKIIYAGVGSVGEGDIKTASGGKNSIIIGFNVNIDERAKTLAERDNIEIAIFDVIYKLTDWLNELVKKRTPKILVEVTKGRAKILKLFNKEKDKQIVGGKVLEGEITADDEVKIFRRQVEIGKGKIKELQKQKIRVGKIQKDNEFGALIQSGTVIAAEDIVESSALVEK